MIDTAFARALLKENEDPELHEFIALLMKKTREGHLCVQNQTICEKIAYLTHGERSPIVSYKDSYYLRRSFDLETNILTELKRLLHAKPKLSFIPTSKANLYPAQKEALIKAFENRILLISGGPGSGKTFIANALIDSLLTHKQDASILFTAPTGKAAFRIKHPKITQGTLHNLLGLREKMPANFEAKPLIYDFIIVDECSMIDAKLFSQLLSSIPSGTQVVLMGDPDQLPPVEAGFVFPEFFTIPNFPQIHLNQSMRSDRKGILQLAKYIKENDIDSVFNILNDPNFLDVHLVPLPKHPPIPIDNNVTLLTPFKKGYLGSTYCNDFIECNKNTLIKTPLIVTKNDYKFNLMNGDIGYKEGPFGFFPEKISLGLLAEYELAWAISIHKSQGSEFPHVIVLLPEGSEVFGKELIYTAVTRAKLSVTIGAHPETLRNILNQTSPPASNLATRWQDAY